LLDGEGIDLVLMARGLPVDTICLDGAATSHMVPYRLQQERNILQEFTLFDVPKMVEVGGGHQLKSYGRGMLVIGEYRLMALAVEKLQFILLSEPQIIIKGGCVVAKEMVKTFYDDKGKIIVQAPLDREYMLFLLKPVERLLLADGKPNNLMDLWHVRMGHPHDGALRRLVEVATGVKLPANMKTSFCDTCHRSKSTVKPFLNEGINDKLPLEEITVDSSEQVPTPRGFRYSLDITCVGTTYGLDFPHEAEIRL
jgi:hypothetical protein